MDSTVIIETNGDLIYCNEALSALTQIPLRQLRKKKNISEILQFDSPSVLSEEHLGQLTEASPYTEVSIASNTGSLATVQVCFQPVWVNDAKKILVFIKDVTLEQRLQEKYKKELRQKEEVIEKLEGTLSNLSKKNTELDRKIFEISLVLDIFKILSEFIDEDSIIEEVIKKLFSFNFCNIAIVMLRDETPNTFAFHIYKKAPTVAFEKTLVRIASDEMQYQEEFVKNGLLDIRFQPGLDEFYKKRLNLKQLRHVISGPLQTKKIERGAIHVGFESSETVPLPEDVSLFRTIAYQISITIESIKFFERSITDEMTMLFNKRYFLSRLESEFDKSKRFNQPLSFLIADVDHFKTVNDTYGHPAGDIVLKKIAEIMKASCRKYDIPARYGGEEFVVILPNTPVENAQKFAERLREKVEAEVFQINDKKLKSTISLGISTYPQQGESTEDLINFADKALYEAKNSGRNKSIVYSASLSKSKTKRS